jgi:hypothetical protein
MKTSRSSPVSLSDEGDETGEEGHLEMVSPSILHADISDKATQFPQVNDSLKVSKRRTMLKMSTPPRKELDAENISEQNLFSDDDFTIESNLEFMVRYDLLLLSLSSEISPKRTSNY